MHSTCTVVYSTRGHIVQPQLKKAWSSNAHNVLVTARMQCMTTCCGSLLDTSHLVSPGDLLPLPLPLPVPLSLSAHGQEGAGWWQVTGQQQTLRSDYPALPPSHHLLLSHPLLHSIHPPSSQHQQSRNSFQRMHCLHLGPLPLLLLQLPRPLPPWRVPLPLHPPSLQASPW